MYLASKKVAIDKETAQCTHKLEFLSVQCKLKDAASLETSSHLWNRPLLGFHPGQLSILHASSDTLPTPMNLHQWQNQASSVCRLCKSSRPTIAHILNGCSVALQQGKYTYQHDDILMCLLSDIWLHCGDAVVYADIDGCRTTISPLATISPSIVTTSYRPDIVI